MNQARSVELQQMNIESTALPKVSSRIARALATMGAMVSLLACAVDLTSQNSSMARMERAVSDASKPHEIGLLGINPKGGWHIQPYVAMGTEPYGSAIPGWWKGQRFPEWRSLAAWFTVYVGTPGHQIENTGVEIGGIEVWALLESSRQWNLLGSRLNPSWQGAFNLEATDSLRRAGGIVSSSGTFVATPTSRYMVHGGIPQVAVPWDKKADLRALLVSVKHRLVPIDPAKSDDRQSAIFGVMAGADYYPYLGAKVSDLGASVNPGAGSGRFLRSTLEWRYSTMLLTSKDFSPKEWERQKPPAFVH